MTAPDYVTMTSLKIPLALKGVSTDAPATKRETAKLFLMLKDHKLRPLTEAQADALLLVSPQK